jgi:hypothetical protein
MLAWTIIRLWPLAVRPLIVVVLPSVGLCGNFIDAFRLRTLTASVPDRTYYCSEVPFWGSDSAAFYSHTSGILLHKSNVCGKIIRTHQNKNNNYGDLPRCMCFKHLKIQLLQKDSQSHSLSLESAVLTNQRKYRIQSKALLFYRMEIMN